MLIAAIPAMADAGDKIIRFGVVYSSPTGEYTEIYEDFLTYEEITLEADAAIGPYFGFEFMVTDLIGLDGTIFYTDHDMDYCYFYMYDGMVEDDFSGTLGSFTTMPLFFSAHFHVAQNPAIDYYLGPTVGYVFFGDLEFDPEEGGGSVGIDDEFAYGVVTGIDVPVGGGAWSFSAALRYLWFDAGPDEIGSEKIGFDPWILQVGASKRW
jgi:outer membrane protein W